MNISRILHAGYFLESAGATILFDPVFENPFSRNCFAYPEVEFDRGAIRKLRPDAIFISHYHDDHCSFESLDLLDRQTPVFIYCVHEEMPSLLRELGFKSVNSLLLNEPVRVGGFKITPHLALDADIDAVFHIDCEGLNILNAVDSWLAPATVEKLLKTSWDLVLWPFQTMREIEVLAPEIFPPADRHPPAELMQQLKALHPRAVVPGSCQFIQESWSWYREAYFPISYAQFAADIREILPQTEIKRMNPGESFELTGAGCKKSGRVPWIHPVGEQDVDYSYDPDLKVPATGEIAKHFPKVAAGAVLDYCRSDLIKKFAALEISEEPFFRGSRIWELQIFDHDGNFESIFYRLEDAKISLLENPENPPDWRTSVPLYKLHAAIFEGEALGSLYLRINEGLDPEKYHNIDVMQDPLIRALYTGVFAGYQKAQLKITRP